MVVVSLDIGTTKICAIAVDSDTGEVLEVLSGANAFMPSEDSHERIQDADRIIKISKSLCGELIRKYSPILCIGITGQMHGILYLNRHGEAVSPLYTWQDQCGNLPYRDQLSYAEYLTGNSPYRMASGFGLTTCFYHTHTGQIPPEAHKICTIQDYAALHMTGETHPIIHTSNGASLGLFDISRGDFDRDIIDRFGMDTDLLPDVTPECTIIGKTAESIPVCVAMGDNQASFLGAAGVDGGSMLINIGTGSQVSVLSDGHEVSRDELLEVRPYLKGMNLITGSPLCGGSSYALLEKFFREVVRMAGFELESVYPHMDALLSKALPNGEPLIVSTRFSGTRVNPHESGKIENISLDNFTPAAMMLGFMEGMAQELYDLAEPVLSAGSFKLKNLVAAGNGMRKNLTMRAILSNKFGLPVKVPQHHEEAAFGAALFAMTGVGRFASFEEAQRLIRYA